MKKRERNSLARMIGAALIMAAGNISNVYGDACCLPNGTCSTVADQAACTALSGCWQGSGSSCTNRFCPVATNGPTGACILANKTCQIRTELNCLCMNSANLDNANINYWLGAGTTCADVQPVNFTPPGPLGGTPGGSFNGSGATLFAPFFQAPAGTVDWNNIDGDVIPCSSAGWSQFKDTNCNGTIDFIGGDRSDQLARDYVCGQNWWGHWLFQYRSVGSVNGYNEFIDFQTIARLPTTVPTELGLINRCQWASGGAKVGACSGCESYCLAEATSGDMNCDGFYNGADIADFVDRILNATPSCSGLAENGDFNGDLLVNLGDVSGFVNCILTGGGCFQNGSTSGQTGTPVCPTSVDFAFLDVPGKWGTRGATGTGAFSKKPNEVGYGQNFVPSFSGFASNLASLSRQKDPNSQPISLNFNVTPNGNTLFDTPVAFVAVVPIATQGVGLQNIRYSEIRHLLVTGRMPNGENLVGNTRDVGSGTRNAYNNSVGIDPSWGMGDNEGNEMPNENPEVRGPGGHLGYVIGGTNNVFHYSNNCGGSGITECAVQNRRLSVGYTGLFGNGRAITDAVAGAYEILNTCKDIDGDNDTIIDSDCTASTCDTGTLPAPGCNGGIPPFGPPSNNTPGNSGFVRPSVDTIVDNNDPKCSFTIGGFGTFVTRGDPESGRNGNTNPAMANFGARDYLRNLKDSITAFTLNPNIPEQQQSPGQFVATRFTLPAGLDRAQDVAIPTKFNPQVVNQPLQDVIRCTTTQITPAYGVSVANKTPQRVNQTPGVIFGAYPGGPAYSDGSVNGQYAYNGATFAAAQKVAGNVNLNDRNEVMGDFDVSGAEKKLRNLNDIAEMMLALCDPRAFELGVNHGGPIGGLTMDHVIPEIIGDFTGDGNFDSKDARYFADGLAIDPVNSKLNRKLGFEEVDMGYSAAPCSGGAINYFGTTLKTRKVYAIGDSRGDIAGNLPHAGSNPEGSDGCIDADDIDYIWPNFISNWTDLSQAINSVTNRRKDLSADVNGDMVINLADVTQLVTLILCTQFGDADLDGDVDAADLAIVNTNLGQPGGWASGDFDGNGIVNAADQTICNANQGFTSPCSLTGPACP